MRRPGRRGLCSGLLLGLGLLGLAGWLGFGPMVITQGAAGPQVLTGLAASLLILVAGLLTIRGKRNDPPSSGVAGARRIPVLSPRERGARGPGG